MPGMLKRTALVLLLATTMSSCNLWKNPPKGWAGATGGEQLERLLWDEIKAKNWAELDKPDHAETLAFHTRLIALRKSQPDLSDPRLDKVEVSHGDQWLVLRRGGVAVAGQVVRICSP